MKCPKCGYNSFEFHDACKKCAHDLTGYKNSHGLKPIVLPHETRAIMAEKLMAGKAVEAPAPVADEPADMFSFDIPDAAPIEEPGAFLKDDPFSFDDDTPAPSPAGADFPFGKDQMSAQAKAEEDAFADLLESTAHTTIAEPSVPHAGETSPQAGSELGDFSWDDTPEPAPGETAKPAKDDFKSLFGDTDESAKK